MPDKDRDFEILREVSSVQQEMFRGILDLSRGFSEFKSETGIKLSQLTSDTGGMKDHLAKLNGKVAEQEKWRNEIQLNMAVEGAKKKQTAMWIRYVVAVGKVVVPAAAGAVAAKLGLGWK